MKDSREKIIKRFLCKNTNSKLVTKENKVYFLLLHEDLYPIIFQNTENIFISKGPEGPKKCDGKNRKENIKKYPPRSFLRVKYLIFLLRKNSVFDRKQAFFSHIESQEKKNSEKFFQLKKKNFFDLIFESIAFILVCNQHKRTVYEKVFVRSKHISSSIHKPLDFLEKQRNYYSFGFQGRLFSLFHPEILIRILRKKFQDISFLHLIRKLLHSSLFENNRTEFLLQKIRNILWNIYVLEIDNFLVGEWEVSCNSNIENYPCINNSVSCLQKINEWIFFLDKEDSKRTSKWNEQNLSSSISVRRNFWLSYGRLLDTEIFDLEDELCKQKKMSFFHQSSTYKYLRGNTNWFLFYQKQEPWNFLAKKRIMLFLIRRLGYVPQRSAFKSTILSLKPCSERSSYLFLAYIFKFSKKRSFVRINTKLFFLINYYVRRIISFINPFYFLILILSKKNFCNSVGYPKSKLGWVTWNDSEIIQQFTRLRNNFFLFYSGCHNIKALYRIQYILYLSCAKTLACKHKTNIRSIYNKFGHNLIIQDFPTELSTFLGKKKSKNYRLRFFYKNQNNIRFWNFHLTQMESIFFSLEDFYRKI